MVLAWCACGWLVVGLAKNSDAPNRRGGLTVATGRSTRALSPSLTARTQGELGMAKVFISYSSDDSDFAELAKVKLEENSIEVWLDQGELHPGDDWRDEIDAGLSASDVLIVVLSERSSTSSYVTFEWAYALGRGARVIPVLLQKAPKHPRLEALQYVDFTNPRVRPWDKLIAEIRRVTPNDAGQAKRKEADAVYSLAIDSYMDRLALKFRTTHFVGFGTAAPEFEEPQANMRSVNAFGEMVAYDAAKRDGEAASELRSVIKRISALRKHREGKVRETLLRLFGEVQASTQSVAAHLSKVRLNTTTLDEPWRVAQESIWQFWQGRSKDVSYFDSHSLDRVKRFLEEHSAYRAVSEEAKADIESILEPGALELEDLLELTRSELEKSRRALADTQYES
jgi:TIR domain-containing protein